MTDITDVPRMPDGSRMLNFRDDGPRGAVDDQAPSGEQTFSSTDGGLSPDGQDEQAMDVGDLDAVPDSPDGYTIEAPEGMSIHDGLAGHFREAAHGAGLSKKQADAVVGAWHSYVKEHQAEMERTYAQQESDFKRAYGSNAVQIIQEARQGFKRVETPALRKLFEETSLGSDLGMVELFLKVERLARATGKPATVADPDDIPRMPDGRPMLRFRD